MSFAKIVLSGSVVNAPEKRFTANNYVVTSFFLLVENPTRSAKGQASEFNVKVNCWRNLAEAVETQIHKGDVILVEGKLTLNSFQTQEGVQKKCFEIEANSIDKLPGVIEPVIVAPSAETAPGGGYSAPASAGQRAANPSNSQASNAPRPVSVGAGASASNTAPYQQFSSEDLTEDDIPF